jgi:hypothetical protein
MAGALMLSSVTPSKAERMQAVCSVSASVHSGKKYVVAKCYKTTDPGDYTIRQMVWEKADRAAYAKMARFAGRQFTCNMTDKGDTRDGGMQFTHYKMEKCH